MPMRLGCRLQVVLDPSPQAPCSMSTAHIRIESRDEIKFPKPANLQPFGLVQLGQQNVGALVFRQSDVHTLERSRQARRIFGSSSYAESRWQSKCRIKAKTWKSDLSRSTSLITPGRAK
jgi:hypothetical protein